MNVKPGVHYSSAENATLAKCCELGYGPNAIAEGLGRNEDAVRKKMRELPPEIRQAGREISFEKWVAKFKQAFSLECPDARHREIVRLHEEGAPLGAFAEARGACETASYSYFRYHGGYDRDARKAALERKFDGDVLAVKAILSAFQKVDDIASLGADHPSPPRRAEVKDDLAALIAHPRWSTRTDHQIVSARAKGVPMTALARELGVPTVTVTQRWHRLRIIPNIQKRLEGLGLSGRPYEVAV